MLLAIGIYEMTNNNLSISYRKVAFAQKDQSVFFNENQLNQFEKQTRQEIIQEDMSSHATLHFCAEKEHHYIKCMSDNSHMIVLVSRTALDPVEAHYLFVNATHAFTRSEQANVTLRNIIDNPMGYTGKDCHIERIKDDLEETKAILVQNVERILERGEKLKQLEESTVQLMEASHLFEDSARNLNKRCCW